MKSTIICDCCGEKMNLRAASNSYHFFRCPNCGFQSARSASSDDKIIFDYDNEPTFDCEVASRFDMLKAEAKRILSHKFSLALSLDGQQERPLRFLDIGCSEGVYVAAAEDLGWDSYGMDVDMPKVKRAQERGLKVSSIDYTEQFAEYFDFIMLRHTLEHIPDFKSALLHAKYLLSAGGILCVETPNQEGLASVMNGKKVKDDRFLGALYPPTHINGFCKRTYLQLGNVLDMEMSKMYTYAPHDPDWVFASLYHGSPIKKLIHSCSAACGMGENIACFYRKKGKYD